MKILVTGGSGFIGGTICKELASQGHQVINYDIVSPDYIADNIKWVYGDITDLSYLMSQMKDCDEAYSISGVLGTSELNYYPLKTINTNIVGVANFFEAARILNVPRVYYVTKPSFTGKMYENLYTWSKQATANLGLFYQQFHKMKVAMTTYYNATGPRQHMIPIRKFIPMACMLALKNYPIEIYGSGEQTVDIIDVRDIANLSIRACRNDIVCTTPEFYDAGTGVAITCNKVAQDIIDYLGSHSQIRHIDMRAGEAPDTHIVSKTHTKLMDILDYKMIYSYEDTIKDTADYYKDLYNDNDELYNNHLGFYMARDGYTK